MQCYVIVNCFKVKMETDDKLLEPFSIFTCICAKLHDSITLTGQILLVSESKLLYTRDVIKVNSADV